MERKIGGMQPYLGNRHRKLPKTLRRERKAVLMPPRRTGNGSQIYVCLSPPLFKSIEPLLESFLLIWGHPSRRGGDDDNTAAEDMSSCLFPEGEERRDGENKSSNLNNHFVSFSKNSFVFHRVVIF